MITKVLLLLLLLCYSAPTFCSY